MLVALWRGQTAGAESLYVLPAGFATGLAHSAIFVTVTAGVEEDETAIACNGLYLMGNVGAVTGLSASTATFQAYLRAKLTKNLENEPDRAKVCLSGPRIRPDNH